MMLPRSVYFRSTLPVTRALIFSSLIVCLIGLAMREHIRAALNRDSLDDRTPRSVGSRTIVL
jgi:hypothetical protein